MTVLTERGVETTSFPAAGDMSANNYKAAVMSAGQVTLAGAGVAVAGTFHFTDGNPVPDTAGDDCPITISGLHLAACGAAIAAVGQVEVDATGRYITLAAAKAVGYAYTTTAAAGDLFLLKLY